jgi:hypothetical protein
MHHALTIPEIVAEIVAAVVDSRSQTRELDLRALSLTCHSFLDPCLDHFWIEGDLFRLASLIPENLREVQLDAEGNSVVRVGLCVFWAMMKLASRLISFFSRL